MNSKVSIITLNYNGKEYLKDCIEAVYRQSYKDYEFIIVDNASTDGSQEFIKLNYPGIILIESPNNLGFAGGNNLGVKRANGELIVLLNNDTTVEEGWLENLVSAVNQRDVAIASSLIISDHVPRKYYEKNGSVNFLGHNIMLIFDKEGEIFTSSGASLIFKKDILGLPFDEDYFAYCEDVYLGLRARFMGYNILHINKSVVHHLEGGSFKKQSYKFRTYLQERNRLLNTILFFSPKTLTKLIPLFIFNFFAKVSASIIMTKSDVFSKYSLSGLLKAYLWFPFNIKKIIAKRTRLKREMKVNEKEIIKYMTCKLTNGETNLGKFLNSLSKFYFYIVRIKTIEFSKGQG